MKTIPLTQGFEALVDDADYDWLMSLGKWQVWKHESRIYAQKWFKRKPRFMHRIILPDALLIDHRDGNGLNNQRINLRERTQSQNMLNPTNILNINNTSGRRGVFWDNHQQRWIAAVRISGRQKKLGTFQSFDDACFAREKFEKEFLL